MHEIYMLKDKLCEELEKYGSKGDLSTGDLEVVDKLAHAVKNLGKIIEMDEEAEYSGAYDGMTYTDGMGGRNASYRGGSYRGGSYARGGGRGRGATARRDSMGRYSREGGYSRAATDLAGELRDLMDRPEYGHLRGDMQRLVDKMEQM